MNVPHVPYNSQVPYNPGQQQQQAELTSQLLAQAQIGQAFPHVAAAPAPHPAVFLVLDVDRAVKAVFASETKAWDFVRKVATDSRLTMHEKCLTVEKHEVK